MSKVIPNPICFLEVDDRERINWERIEEDRKTDPDFASDYDFNIDDYEIVDTNSYNNDYGDFISQIVVRRISDGKHFKLEIYDDSWSDIYMGYFGSYGVVTEVVGKEVIKIEWTNV